MRADSNRVYVELITDTGERRTIEANEAGEFIIPAREYRIYRVLEEKPEAIFQPWPNCRAYFVSSTGAVTSFPRCSCPSCMGVCRG